MSGCFGAGGLLEGEIGSFSPDLQSGDSEGIGRRERADEEECGEDEEAFAHGGSGWRERD